MRIPVLCAMSFVALPLGSLLAAQQLPSDPAQTLLVATPGYDFHADFWHNLHDYLYWRAQDDGPSSEGSPCIEQQPERDRSAWHAVSEHYRTDMKDRHWRRDPIMRATRYTLSGLAPQPDSVMDPVFERLRQAAPVYRTCFWDGHLTAARERLATVVPLLLTHGPSLIETLSAHYDAPWPRSIRVDVVSFASYAGANTAAGRTVDPHMQISSIDPSLEGLSGLELLLHEASHEVFGPGRGLVGATISDVSRELGVDSPRDLWHAMSFFTTGYVQSAAMAEVGVEYSPYWLHTGLMSRAWPEYLEPIQTHWPPYLNGEVDARTAVERIVRAIVEGG